MQHSVKINYVKDRYETSLEKQSKNQIKRNMPEQQESEVGK